jgi:squalene-associated FAD-dependent desaturase
LDHHAIRVYMMPHTVHIIGSGLAGLAAAVALAEQGVATIVHEATDQAGGRCRSYDDAASGMRIDNGTHILLSGNKAALGFLTRIGSAGLITGAPAARFPFIDLATKQRWTLDLGVGRLPLWMFDPHRRAPRTRARDYVGLARLMWPTADQPLCRIMSCAGPAYEQVMRPLLLAALNTDPKGASSDLARAVVWESIAQGGAACRPYLVPRGLSAAFVEPAMAYLRGHGGVLCFGHQLRRCVAAADAVTALDFGDDKVAVGPDDAVVLAVPPYAAGSIIPQLQTPDEFRAIVNAHFRIVPPPGPEPMLGIFNGTAEWLFFFEDRISATISGADRFMQHTKDELARMIWRDVQRVAKVAAEMPPWQIVRERRATFAATPSQNAKRAGVRTAWRNLALAGDWTNTGLPPTIESAVRSGTRAADFIMQS